MEEEDAGSGPLLLLLLLLGEAEGARDRSKSLLWLLPIAARRRLEISGDNIGSARAALTQWEVLGIEFVGL